MTITEQQIFDSTAMMNVRPSLTSARIALKVDNGSPVGLSAIVIGDEAETI
ncbi:MAG: hypothetical protein QM669_03980 [Siphonobacter sp.]